MVDDVRWHLNHVVHKDKPWAVQVEAMRRAAGRPRYGQWLQQGLGKTPLTLNEFVDTDAVDINIVIAPNSFKLDWVLAPAEWGLGFMHTGMWPNDPLPFNQDCALYAINYESVRYDPFGANNGFNALMQLLEKRRCLLTIDESKAIGNPSSKTTKGVVELAHKAAMVRELNGTPMTESPMDYYGQLRALGELRGVLPRAFRNRYCEVGGFMGRKVQGVAPGREEELARLLDKVSFRALKKDWRKDLPEQLNVPMHLEMTDKQWRHYKTMMEEFYVEIDDRTAIADLIITQQEKLRQISSGLYKQDDDIHWFEQPKDLPKVKALLDLIDNGPTKFIAVYMYKPSGAMLLDILRKEGYDPAYIRGGMTAQELIEQKNKFNNDPGCRGLIGQEVATARGHTLIGGSGKDRCNRIMFYEQHQGLYWREQMKDRNHRGEQDMECTLYDFISSPMEQITVDRLVSKLTKAQAMDAWVKEVRRTHK